MTTAYRNITAEIRDEVLWLRVNRRESRNALSRATLGELAAACAHDGNRNAVKAAVLTGDGDEAFAAGGDLKELSALRSEDEVAEFFDFASRSLDQIRTFPVPVVAALNGWALGGGAELALACDFRIAARHAAIGYIHGRLSICCGFGGGADLMRLLGASSALLHGLTAEPVNAPQALALGLVDRVAAEGESIEACVWQFLAPILRQEPQVIRAYKAMAIAERQGLGLDARRAIERDGFSRTWTHEDHWSSVEKFERSRRERVT
jgi:enoyl-CoA hydratase